MKNNLLNEISRIKYLSNYSKGRVISEQVDYKKYDQFDLLVNYFRYVGDKKYTLDVNGSRFYANNDADRFIKITLRKQALYLFDGGDVKNFVDGKLTKVGTWQITQDQLNQNPIFTITPLPTSPETTTQTDPNATTQTDPNATTQTDPVVTTQRRNKKTNLPINVPLEKITAENTEIVGNELYVSDLPGFDVISPIKGVVTYVGNESFDITNKDGIRILFYGLTTSLKKGDKVSKGQNLGKSSDYMTFEVMDVIKEVKIDAKNYFKIPTTIQADPAANTQADPAANTQADPAANTQADPAATTQTNPAANTQADPAATTQTNPAATTSTTIEKMDFPIKVPFDKIQFEFNDTESIVMNSPKLDVISPIDGQVSTKSGESIFIYDNDRKFQLYIFGLETSLKQGDKISKGQTLGKSQNYISIRLANANPYKILNLKDYFKF